MKLDSDTTCGLCGAQQVFVKYRIGNHRILRCRPCTFMWLHPMPKKEDLHKVYDSSYFQNEKFFDGTNETIFGYYDYLSERFTKQLRYRSIMEHIASLFKGFEKNRSRLLDVGCGFGFLLDAAQDAGFLVEGIEFNAHAVECAKQKYAFPIQTGDVLGYQGPTQHVITMFDVIEHLPDPILTVRKIYDLLEPEGLFVITTMDCDSMVSRLLGTRLEDFRRICEHLTFYTRSSLRKLLEAQGFEVIHEAFHGHTFRLDFLAERICLINKPLGHAALMAVRALRIGSVPVHINPMTKMIVVARKKA